uniref:MYND-type domain-containing protein n=1 Tax=Mantoniella antarctica TaxID=81844 RepID=A0A7S0SFY9_9CHLO|mmetsp:Transcript_21864/g.54061  ORF Transcript_21864/g.54061 Transcript_21864/m.54061 type:complete len:368 (+) Transcript_21864:423-1526(+)|eukprot:CAMPEP_0181356126 /NCGR_PEP_ID=MMETSP1106-20121128/4258_1 /TAXON_ID=81844 /ORGANISM="Mantoniella antarctica, Strain SL-175" /LENGTH=367 /DNA_ID=CAMNT_0023468895 /DNA_START=338 /DNA_END=1441 /DNA_ORIENTATION=-
MDSTRHALNDALDDPSEVERLSTNQASDAAPDRNHQFLGCSKCHSVPAAGLKLRHCGGCQTRSYCGKACAKADWAEHKRHCERLRGERGEAMATHLSSGGLEKDFNKARLNFVGQFLKVPGLSCELTLLAWRVRSEAPVIIVSTSKSDVDFSRSRIRSWVVPRRIWDEDQDFTDNSSIRWRKSWRTNVRQIYDGSSFCPDKQFVCVFVVDDVSKTVDINFSDNILRGVEIVAALTAATTAEDLANAFAWMRASPAVHASKFMQSLQHRAASFYGSTGPTGSIPDPSRAINNEVAYTMCANFLLLQFEVRLMGLRGAAHLNGREGVIRSIDPANKERWSVRLDDGTCVSVKAGNFEHVRRGDYKRMLL